VLLLILFVVADLLAGLWLLVHGWRTDRWHRVSVPIVGVLVLACGLGLTALGVEAHRRPPAAPQQGGDVVRPA